MKYRFSMSLIYRGQNGGNTNSYGSRGPSFTQSATGARVYVGNLSWDVHWQVVYIHLCVLSCVY